MTTPKFNNFTKQTALFMLCGLLPCLCSAQRRTVTDATLIAEDFIGQQPRMQGIGMKLKNPSSYFTNIGGDDKAKGAFYIFTSEQTGKGFVIVSGDERLPKVLAYSDESPFDVDSIPPNVRYWLDCYTEAFTSLDDNKEETDSQRLPLKTEGVAPLLGSNEWGQDDPFNRLCPSVRNEKCVTGCVATAMSQVMKYHRYPVAGKGNANYRTETNGIHIQHDIESTIFKWEDMLDDYKSKFTEEQGRAVAELMYACGTSVKMDYCTSEQGGSGAYQTDLITAFVNNFYYDENAALMSRNYCSVEDWHELLVKELNEGRPVNYAGQSTRDGGHSFVLDGYRVNADSKYPDYHVNWGWNGKCNGYYQVANLHPSENGQHATMGGFNSSQQMTIGIMPDDGIDNSLFYLCTPNLYVSSSTAKPGSTIQVYTSSCINFSYKPFQGTIHVAIKSLGDDTEIILGESRVRFLNYLQEHNNLNLEITLPADLPDGEYNVRLLSKQQNGNYQEVYSRQYPLLTVATTGKEPPISTGEAMLGCSELEINNDAAPSIISLNIYELQNLQESPFIGDLKMIFADMSGKQLCTFGDSIQPGELSTFEIQEEPITIQGQLLGDWQDGNYRIYVGARQLNTSQFVYLSYYDSFQPDMTYQDLSIEAQIIEGKLVIKGKTYVISPTSIKTPNEGQKKKNDTYVYRIDGTCLGRYSYHSHRFSPGVYVIRQGENVRKLFIK